MIRTGAIWVARFDRFVNVRNDDVVAEKTAATATVTASIARVGLLTLSHKEGFAASLRSIGAWVFSRVVMPWLPVLLPMSVAAPEFE